MLVINYKGITPQQRFYSLGVQGNNNANAIAFVVEKNQGDYALDDMVCYLKVANKEHEYIDKIKLTDVNDDGTFLTILWTMTRKSTAYRNLELQLQFEDEEFSSEVIFQTQIIELELSNTINADKEIEEQYPSVIKLILEAISEIKANAEKIISMTYENDVLTLVSQNVNGVQKTYSVNIPTSDKLPVVIIGNNLNTKLKDLPSFGFMTGSLSSGVMIDNYSGFFHRDLIGFNNRIAFIFEGGGFTLSKSGNIGNQNLQTFFNTANRFYYATTIQLDEKVEKTTEANKIYGTDEDGEQTTFNDSDFAKMLGSLPNIPFELSDDVQTFMTTYGGGAYILTREDSSHKRYFYRGAFSQWRTTINFRFVEILRGNNYQGSFQYDENPTFADLFSNENLENYELVENKSQTINEQSTTQQYPSSVAVKNYVETMVSALAKYMGNKSVAEINAIDTSTLRVGYFFNMTDSGVITLGNIEVYQGDNIMWTGDSWDKFTIDLSVYDDKFISAGFFEVEDYDEDTGNISFVYESDLYDMSYNDDTGVLTIDAQ